ncbi:MAG: methyltransferase type 11 [Betaproteobacteria bacterium RIFCSPLOWO2_02_FULL_65_24]|nr:MAG: methyltransferase type 11 [Betaproteobacteria bacterium RIFCSPLOWO2_02_FULL_65_24]
MLSDWFDTPQGQYVLAWEQAQFDSAVDDVFGYYAVQVGLPRLDFLRENRIPLHVTVGLDSGSSVRAEPWTLPLASQSIDLVVLPHVLEFSPHPHHILREAERVLMPEGSIVIAGFNPLSLWGARRTLDMRREYPWSGRFIGLLRLRDWLHLLGFELNGGKFGCYAPPFIRSKWLERAGFMEKAGDRWWPIGGGVYVVRAVKHTVGMRIVMPSWKDMRAPEKALAPAARRQGARRTATVTRIGPRRKHG